VLPRRRHGCEIVGSEVQQTAAHTGVGSAATGYVSASARYRRKFPTTGVVYWPPPTVALVPLLLLNLPPPTVALVPLLLLYWPPPTVDEELLAGVVQSPPTVAHAPLLVFCRPPPTVAWSPLLVLFATTFARLMAVMAKGVAVNGCRGLTWRTPAAIGAHTDSQPAIRVGKGLAAKIQCDSEQAVAHSHGGNGVRGTDGFRPQPASRK